MAQRVEDSNGLNLLTFHRFRNTKSRRRFLRERQFMHDCSMVMRNEHVEHASNIYGDNCAVELVWNQHLHESGIRRSAYPSNIPDSHCGQRPIPHYKPPRRDPPPRPPAIKDPPRYRPPRRDPPSRPLNDPINKLRLETIGQHPWVQGRQEIHQLCMQELSSRHAMIKEQYPEYDDDTPPHEILSVWYSMEGN